MTELYFGRRFCGPPDMVNGGFACGSIAVLYGGAAQVTLRRPLPLERPLAARHDGHGALLVRDGDTLLAESHSAAPVELAAPAVSLHEARAVAGQSRYYTDPVFPPASCAGWTAGQATGCESSPGRCQAERYGPRHGHRTPRSRARTGASGPRRSGPRSTVPAD